jgi:hypothetical protein
METENKNYENTGTPEKMRVVIELVTAQDVQEFTAIVAEVDCDVRLVGKDEHGNDWNLSAKSLYGSLILASHAKENAEREHTAHEVDWNTIYCECEKDIYSLIRKFAR